MEAKATSLRQRMTEDLRLRNYSKHSEEVYLREVALWRCSFKKIFRGAKALEGGGTPSVELEEGEVRIRRSDLLTEWYRRQREIRIGPRDR